MPVVESSPSSSESKHRLLHGALLVAVAAFAAFASSLLNGFVWDDHVFLKKFQEQADGDVSNVFLEPYAHGAGEFLGERIYYRPACSAFYLANYSIFGHKPFGYHLMNLLLHAAVSMAVFLLFVEISRDTTLSLGGALLFAVHPVHAENVAWISGLTDPLCALFLVGALILGSRGVRSGSRKVLIPLSLALALLAMFAKELGVVFLPIVVLLLSLKENINKRRATVLVLFGASVTVSFLVWRSWILGHVAVFSGRVLDLSPTRVLTATKDVFVYLQMFILPWWSSPALDSMPVQRVLDPVAIGSALALVGITVAAVRWRRTPLGWGWCFFLISLFPCLGIVPIGDTLAERFLYVPSIGLSIALVEGLRLTAASLLSRRLIPRVQRALFAGAFILLCGLAATAFSKAQIWKSDLAFFEAATRAGACDSMYWFNYGLALQGEGRENEAESAYLEAVKRGKEVHLPLNNLGTLALKKGNAEKAEQFLREAVRHDPQYGTAWLNLSEALVRLERPEEALASLRRALQYSPEISRRDPVALHFLMGRCYAVMDPERALPHLSTVLESNPDNLQARLIRGSVYAARNRLENAIADFQDAATRHPELPEPWIDLGRALAFKGDYSAARDAYRRAIQLAPEDTDVRVDLAAVLIEMDRSVEAVEILRDLLQRVPEHSRARFNLGLALFKLANRAEAKEQLQLAVRVDPSNTKAQELLKRINDG